MPVRLRTPEDLATLFEDAFVLRDGRALLELFEAGGMLAIDGGTQRARGGGEIARLATEMWDHGRTFLANRGEVLQVHDIALVLAYGGVTVARRGDDGAWRYAISFLQFG